MSERKLEEEAHPQSMKRTRRIPPLAAMDQPHDTRGPEQTLASAILLTLQRWGCSHIFLVPGAQIDGFAQHLSARDVPSPIVANHELAAGYMADGYSRASGRMGVAMAIGGPGAANLLGAAAAAKADASSVLFITGDIPVDCQGRREFQDAGPAGTNDSEVFLAAIGESMVLDTAEAWHECMQSARQCLLRGQPVHLLVPLDVQRAHSIDAGTWDKTSWQDPDLIEFPDWLAHGRPVIAIGGRAIDSIDMENLHAWVARWALPVITDAAARGILDEMSPYALGHIGFMPHPRALAALGGAPDMAADRVISVGLSDDRLDHFAGRSIPRHEIDPRLFNTWLNTSFAVADPDVMAIRTDWLHRLWQIERKPSQATVAGSQIPLAALVVALAANLPKDTIYCIDAGQVRRLAVSRLRSPAPRTILSAEGLASMGWGICAAIGAKLACPDRTVTALVGDGSMRMHGMELATAARYCLPVLFVICDNQGYGSILSRQESQAALASLPPVDWCAFAKALGMSARRLHSLSELPTILADFHGSGTPLLLTVSVPLVDVDTYLESSGIRWLNQLKDQAYGM